MHRRSFARGIAATTGLFALPSLVAARGDKLREPGASPGFENTWESPALGAVFSWADPWEGEDAGNDVATSGLETFILTTDDLAASVWLNAVSIDFHGSESALLDSIEASLDPDTLAETMGWADGVALVHLDRSADSIVSVIAFGAGDSFRAEYREVRLVNDAYGLDISLSAPAADCLDWYDTAMDTVAADGNAPFSILGRGDLADILAGIEIPAGDDTGDPEPDEDDPSDAGALADVRSHLDTLIGTPGEFVSIISTEEMSDRQVDRANEILGLWFDASSVAATVDLPPAYGDLEDTYLTYTSRLEDAAVAFVAIVAEDSTEAQRDTAFDDFGVAIEDATALEPELDDLLTAAGA